MSNKLRKKKKPMQPLGFDKKTLAYRSDAYVRQRNTDDLLDETHLNLRLIAYQILHDKFGFGNKRISRVHERMEKYLRKAAVKQVTFEEFEFLLKNKYGVDPRAEANKVPFNERFYLTKKKILEESKYSAGMYILATICNYFALLGTCLKIDFKFSANQIKKTFYHIRDYINTLSRPKQFGLTIEMIAKSVKKECGYVDKRFFEN